MLCTADRTCKWGKIWALKCEPFYLSAVLLPSLRLLLVRQSQKLPRYPDRQQYCKSLIVGNRNVCR
jgi:hypothetical protein